MLSHHIYLVFEEGDEWIDYASYPEDLGVPGGTFHPDAADDTPA